MKIFDLPGLLNINRFKNNQTEKKGNAFKTGDVVEGKVLEAKAQALTLMLNSGKMLRLQDLGNQQHELGDSLKMELVKEGDVLMGKVLDAPAEQTTQKEDLSEGALKQIGLETTEERKTVAKLLRMNSVPITKSNVLALTEAKKYISRLSDLIKSNLIDASKLPIDKNIKTVLVEHLNKSDQLYVSPQNKGEMTVKELISAEIDLTKDNTFVQKDGVLTVDKQEMQELKQADSPFSKAAANAYLSEKLDKVEYKSLVFNLKNNVENTVKNLVLLDKVILGSDSVTKQIERFSKNIKYIFNKSNISENSHPALIKLLHEFEEVSLRDFDKFEKTAEKLIESLKQEPSMTAIDKDVLGSQVVTIKGSLSYLNDMSQNLVFIQMPVKLNDQMQNMDLYIKKNPKKKQIDPNHCSIFLSLDTDKCHTVKTLIELNREKANITFKLKDEEMVNYFNDHLDELSEALKDKGYLNLSLNAIEFIKDDHHILEDEDTYEDHVIDVKL